MVKTLWLGLLVVAAACGDRAGSSSASPTVSSSGAPVANASPTNSETAAPPKTVEVQAPQPGTLAELRERATSVMTALKKGDAKAAADFCLGKHRPAFEKFIAETIEKKDQSRAKAYQAFNGTLGEIRIEGDMARVAFGKDEKDGIDYLSFRKKELGWSLDDIPVKRKAEWEKWGTPATD